MINIKLNINLQAYIFLKNIIWFIKKLKFILIIILNYN